MPCKRIYIAKRDSHLALGAKNAACLLRQFLLVVFLSACATTANRPTTIDTKVVQPEVVQWCEKHVRNFQELRPGQRQTVLYVVNNFYHYFKYFDSREKHIRAYLEKRKLPVFVDKGISILLLNDGEKMTDLPELRQLKGKKVNEVFFGYGDGLSGNRLMDDVGGEGSHRLVVVRRRDIPDHIHGGYAVIYHEFAHLIHQTGFSEAELTELAFLYQNAKSKNLFLSEYAATNETEYYAVSVEAYLSKTKERETGEFNIHGREDLKIKDPQMYRFVKSTLD